MIESVDTTVEQENVAEVVTISEGDYILKYENETMFAAKRAPSCLVDPQVGDTVGLFFTKSDVYIVYVLERDEKRTMSISSESEIELTSRKKLSLSSPAMAVESCSVAIDVEKANTRFKEASITGMVFEGSFNIIKSFANSVEHMVTEMIERYDRSYTYVNEHEEVQTHSSRHISEENRVVQCKNYVVTAEDQMKLDAENIHLA